MRITVLLSSSFKSMRVRWEWDSPNECIEVSDDLGVFVVDTVEKADKEFEEESVEACVLSLMVSLSSLLASLSKREGLVGCVPVGGLF